MLWLQLDSRCLAGGGGAGSDGRSPPMTTLLHQTGFQLPLWRRTHDWTNQRPSALLARAWGAGLEGAH